MVWFRGIVVLIFSVAGILNIHAGHADVAVLWLILARLWLLPGLESSDR